jgi:hypothetical protein
MALNFVIGIRDVLDAAQHCPSVLARAFLMDV